MLQKNKRTITTTRHAANTIDSIDNDKVVIVSVLMLKEGWDVNNVTTIVELRPFAKPKILQSKHWAEV